jgi:hypothetical protein
MAPLASIQHFQLGSGKEQVTVEVGSGVILKAARGGAAGNWKGLKSFRCRVLSIFLKKGSIHFRGQYLNERKDLTRDLELNEVPRGTAHQLWPSDLEDVFEASSIIGSFTIYHHRIVAALYPNQEPTALKARGIFMFETLYITRKGRRLPSFVSAPKFPDPSSVYEWPLLDIKVLDGVVLNLVQAMKGAMNVVNGGGRQSVKLPIPLGCIPALVALPWQHRTATASYIFEPDQRVLDSLLGKGWDTKLIDRGFEKVKAVVVLSTLKMRWVLLACFLPFYK